MQYHKDSTCNISALLDAGLIVSLNRSAKCLINVTRNVINECLVIGPFGPIEKVSINAKVLVQALSIHMSICDTKELHMSDILYKLISNTP